MPDHKIVVRFADGVEFDFQADEQTRILDAALAHDIPILKQCQSGSCGTCVAMVAEGEMEMVTGTAVALLPSEIKEGMRLTCQSIARSDCTLSISYPSSVGENEAAEGMAEVLEAEWLSDNVVKLTLEMPEDWEGTFEPGQYMQLQVPGTDQWRSFSMSSPPAALPEIEFIVRILEQGGTMSDYLRERVKPGDMMKVEGPFGQFVLRDSDGPRIMIAGGTGLSPMMSMLDYLRKAKKGKKPPIVLSFGTATQANLFHTDELELREFWMRNLECRVSIDQGPAAAESVRIGDPVSAITADDIAAPGTTAYLCGPPGMIDAARRHLIGLGLPAEAIFAEQFVASGEDADGPETTDTQNKEAAAHE